MEKHPLLALSDLGQSVWLDNIERGMLQSGELARMIREDGLKGITSNPTIFQKAIKDSDLYDAAIREKSTAGVRGEALFFYALAADNSKQVA